MSRVLNYITDISKYCLLKRREPSTDHCGTHEETAKCDEKGAEVLTEEYLSVR